MPKIDCSKMLIYKIVCKDINVKDLYVGSTTNYHKRKQHHKCVFNNKKSEKYNYALYKCIRDNGGWDNFEMILIENYPCEYVQEAHKQERLWLEKLNANLNMVIPIRTREEIKEYYIINIENKKDYQKQYNITNADKIKDYQKQYRINNVEKIKEGKKQYYQKKKFLDTKKEDISTKIE